MKNLQTLKLSASSIGSSTHYESRPETSDAPTREHTPAPASPPAPRAPRPALATALRKQMLVLLVVEAAAVLAAVAATGDIHNTIFRIASAGIALTVALVVAIEAAASLRRTSKAAAAAAPVAQRLSVPTRSLTKTKLALLLVMAVGFATYFGGGGAFGTFTAEDTNPNSNIASGTLTMSNTVNNRTTACFSYNGAANNNVNQNCDVAFNMTGTGSPNSAAGSPANPSGGGNLGPGAFGAVAKIAVQNTGSLDAGTLTLVAPYVNATLHTTAIPTGTFTSIKVNDLEGPITSGDTLLITYGSQTLSVCASGAYAPVSPITTDVTVNVTACPSGTATNGTGATIPVGASVTDTSSDTGATNTDCYDQKATTNPVAGATVGSSLTFNTGNTTNLLCNTAQLYVQEVGTNSNYCWFGVIDGTTEALANGMCAAPISTSPTTNPGVVTNTTYTVAALTGNVKSGDQVAFTQGNNVVTCLASANAFMGDTSITVSGCGTSGGVNAGTNSGFTTAAVITDPSTLSTLNGGSSPATLASFDTSKSGTNGIPLYPVSSNGVDVPGAPVLLGKVGSSNATRTFYVGVFLPNANGTNQNTIQGLMSTFGLTWHLGS